ncbi:MAG: YidB family protein [Cyanobacteria bacterium P01_A01_bin.3]
MDLLNMGKELLGDKLGENSNVMQALSGITGDGGFDLSGLASKLKDGGLADKLGSWLGDGDNEPVSGDEITSALGEDKISAVASKLGIDSSAAADKLSNLLPGLLDKASSGGQLLDKFSASATDAIDGAIDKAKGMFH